MIATGQWISIPLCWANKCLQDNPEAPRPYDTTLPHHRPDEGEMSRSFQKEYPTWYFLTGTIAHPENFMKLLKLKEFPDMREACVRGLIEVRSRQCAALFEPTTADIQNGNDVCHGWAYRVKNIDEERALRYFKSDSFEVVRCRITLSKRNTFATYTDVDGWTFKFSKDRQTFQMMNKTPIKSIQGAVGSSRIATNTTKCPLVMSFKAVPTTGVTCVGALATPLTTTSTAQSTESAWWNDGEFSAGDSHREEVEIVLTTSRRQPVPDYARSGPIVEFRGLMIAGPREGFQVPNVSYPRTMPQYSKAGMREQEAEAYEEQEIPFRDDTEGYGHEFLLPTNNSFINNAVWNYDLDNATGRSIRTDEFRMYRPSFNFTSLCSQLTCLATDMDAEDMSRFLYAEYDEVKQPVWEEDNWPEFSGGYQAPIEGHVASKDEESTADEVSNVASNCSEGLTTTRGGKRRIKTKQDSSPPVMINGVPPEGSGTGRARQRATNRAALSMSIDGTVAISRQQSRADVNTVREACSLGISNGYAYAAYSRIELSMPRPRYRGRRRSCGEFYPESWQNWDLDRDRDWHSDSEIT